MYKVILHAISSFTTVLKKAKISSATKESLERYAPKSNENQFMLKGNYCKFHAVLSISQTDIFKNSEVVFKTSQNV